jgi:hypothetical protein
MAPAILLAMTLHLAAMVVSGIVFFATVAGSAALEYALAYNAVTVVPETLLVIWLVPPLARAIARANPADAWRRDLLAPPPATQRIPRRWRPPVPRIPATDMIPPSSTAPTTSLTPRLTPTPVSRKDADARPAASAPRTSFLRPSPFAKVADRS